MTDYSQPDCRCDDSGEHPECPHHGYEATIRRLAAERDELLNAMVGIYHYAGSKDSDRTAVDVWHMARVGMARAGH